MPSFDPLVIDHGGQHYPTQLGIYDEMYAAENKALPYWERFMAALEAMGSEKLELRRREAQRLLRENGVTYNVYGDTQNLTRPWRLDPVPLLISGEEWTAIEAGLKQRAELLNLIFKDIYAAQHLLKKGLLPAELIFGHEGFLRPCVQSENSRQHSLTLYSANLARDPKGRMWVLNDRTQAPSGMGYALENRTVITRVLPDILRETKVVRLSSFFKTLQKSLAEMAPHNKEDPRIVVLTPGPLNETYFEHAYLAAHLGLTLVQGGDLTVRDGRLWLKSISGLQPVDVVLRRVDDSYCDPLAFRSNSQLGVAGLLEVVRRGNVAITNPLGSSILENPGFLAFLPALARYFLHEELKLPSVATWWCGQKRERDFVLQNLDNLVIKPINRGPGSRTVFGGELSNAEKENLRQHILAKPHLYVGQEQVGFSTLPAFVDHRVEPRNAILRNFVVASQGEYVVMPGGLTRVAPRKDEMIVSNQAGGISKDTWVLASAPEKTIAAWSPPRPAKFAGPLAEPLTSRAADNLFWVGRHLERIETSARLMRTILSKLRETQEHKDPLDIACMNILLPSLTQVTGTYPGFVGGGPFLLKQPETELLAIVKNSGRKGSLTANIQSFVHAAFSIRDLWSQDTWRCIDTMQRRWQQRVIATDICIEKLHHQLDELITGAVAFSGLTSESMTREAAWLMLDSGRRLERALGLIALLRSTAVLQNDEALQNQILEAVLVSTDSLTIYQRRYRSFIQLPRVLELLLLDESHPRSVNYQIKQLSAHISALPRRKDSSYLSEEERLILQTYTDLRLSNVSDLTKPPENSGIYPALDALLANTAKLLWRISEVFAEVYFSHSQTAQFMILKPREDEP